MIARLPNGARPYLFPGGAHFSVDNVLLYARARRHRVVGFVGPLSIKTVVQGAVAWQVGGRQLLVEPGTFLVLGAGERYSMDIDAVRPVQTACAFFRDGYVEEMAQDATAPLEESLDDPTRSAPPLPYLSRLHGDAGGTLTGAVQTMAHRSAERLQPSGLEDEFLRLSSALLQLYEEIRARIARVPAARPSTRRELFRRLETGREFLHSQPEGPLSLETIARAASLSRYHFHRTFTQVYGETPHDYLTGLRLGRAHAELRTGRPVLETALAAGFGNPSSFARAFRRRFGVTPSAVRRG